MRVALWVLPLIALANVVVIFMALDGRSLAGLVVSPFYLFIAVIFAFLPWLTNSLRLVLWSHFLGLDLRARQVLRVIIGTLVVSAVTPTGSGGPALKLALLANEGIPGARAATIISFQVAEDALALALLTLTSMFFIAGEVLPSIDVSSGLGNPWAFRFLALSAAFLVGLVLIDRSMRVGLLGQAAVELRKACLQTLDKWRVSIFEDWRVMILEGRGVFICSMVLALVQWTARFSIAALVIAALGAPVQATLFWVLQYLVQFAGSFIPTPGAAGGTEAVFALLFAPFIPSQSLLPAVAIWRLIFFYLPLATGAAILLVSLRLREAQKQT